MLVALSCLGNRHLLIKHVIVNHRYQVTNVSDLGQWLDPGLELVIDCRLTNELVLATRSRPWWQESVRNTRLRLLLPTHHSERASVDALVLCQKEVDILHFQSLNIISEPFWTCQMWRLESYCMVFFIDSPAGPRNWWLCMGLKSSQRWINSRCHTFKSLPEHHAIKMILIGAWFWLILLLFFPCHASNFWQGSHIFTSNLGFFLPLLSPTMVLARSCNRNLMDSHSLLCTN